MLEVIADTIREYKNNSSLEITPQTTFASLNLDSLEEVELIMTIGDKLGKDIDIKGDVNTVGDLVDMIEKEQ